MVWIILSHVFLSALLCSYVNFMWEMTTLTSDAPPSSLMDSAVSPKKKTMEGEGVGVHSLACNTSGVERHAIALGWDKED